MHLDTPEGTLTIEGDELRFAPADGGKEIHVQLTGDTKYEYQRGVYGTGTLVVGGHAISLDASQAPAVVEELRKPRSGARTRKPDAKPDGAAK